MYQFRNCLVKILGIDFHCNENLENHENYRKHIIKIEKLLKVWQRRQLSIEGKILIFKVLAISKLVHLMPVKEVPLGT